MKLNYNFKKHKHLLFILFIADLQQRRLQEAQDEYDQEQEILKEEFDTERFAGSKYCVVPRNIYGYRYSSENVDLASLLP